MIKKYEKPFIKKKYDSVFFLISTVISTWFEMCVFVEEITKTVNVTDTHANREWKSSKCFWMRLPQFIPDDLPTPLVSHRFTLAGVYSSALSDCRCRCRCRGCSLPFTLPWISFALALLALLCVLLIITIFFYFALLSLFSLSDRSQCALFLFLFEFAHFFSYTSTNRL